MSSSGLPSRFPRHLRDVLAPLKLEACEYRFPRVLVIDDLFLDIDLFGGARRPLQIHACQLLQSTFRVIEYIHYVFILT